MRIEVTQEDIDSGQQCSPAACPISRAIRGALAADYVCVGAGTADVWTDDHMVVYRLPDEANEFVRKFDAHKSSVQPMEFDI